MKDMLQRIPVRIRIPLFCRGNGFPDSPRLQSALRIPRRRVPQGFDSLSHRAAEPVARKRQTFALSYRISAIALSSFLSPTCTERVWCYEVSGTQLILA